VVAYFTSLSKVLKKCSDEAIVELELPLIEAWFVLTLALGKKIRTDTMFKLKPNKNLVSILGYLCYLVNELQGPCLKLLVF
jgi:hypothetical protein